MDAFVNNPFRTQIHEAAAMALTAQKEMITLATGHMQRVGGQTTAVLDMARAGFEAQVATSLALSKMMVDSLAVKSEA